MHHECTEERFLADIKSHEMLVLQDDGLRRHLRFKRPTTSTMYFDIVTWKGNLCYTGDMGTFVFTRIDDMLEFFRGERINPQYWQEKCIASESSRNSGGVREFNCDVFHESVREHIKDYWELEVTPEDLQEALDGEVFCHHDNGYAAYLALSEFKHGEHTFECCEMPTGEVFSYRFIWCCRALVWAIQKYDEAKQ